MKMNKTLRAIGWFMVLHAIFLIRGLSFYLSSNMNTKAIFYISFYVIYGVTGFFLTRHREWPKIVASIIILIGIIQNLFRLFDFTGAELIYISIVIILQIVMLYVINPHKVFIRFKRDSEFEENLMLTEDELKRKLTKLQALKNTGVLTEEEYQDKRTEIVSKYQV